MINNQGSTWEPAKHLISDYAKCILDKYLADKAAIFAFDEQRKKDIMSGVLVITRKPNEVDDNVAGTPNGRRSRSRSNSSPYTVHFSEWYWDNIVTPTAKRSACLRCGEVVSASSTSNFRAHLVARHKQLLVKELRADKVQNSSNISTLKSLKEDLDKVEKLTCAAKRSIDEQFVKWCCKKRRGLSIGETDRELNSLLLQASRGIY